MNIISGKNTVRNEWNNRYKNRQTGWDIGCPSTPLKEYIDGIDNKNQRILIPGCGNAYEAEYLHLLGFKNVFVLDIAELAIQGFQKRVPEFPEAHLILGDFFNHTEKYDLILEQTFFCAIDPELRNTYAVKMSELLVSGGKLAGVMFNFELTKEGPPFGGSASEYLTYFEPHFNVLHLEPCRNSIKPRQGNELWVELENPD